MEKFKRVMWDPKYSVNNEVIDAQHKEFFSLFNRIIDLRENGSIDVYSILQDLVQVVPEQFHKEHLFMRETDARDFLQHSKEHDMFIEAIQGFLNRYEKNDEHLVHDILNFLNDWIYLHILKTDLRYGEHPASACQEVYQPIEKENKPIKELRSTPRIATSMDAYYWKRGSLDIFGKVQKGIVYNLSLGGCCLIAPKNHTLNPDCKIHLAFLLDDRQHTKIEKEVVVCRVTENQIGCKFTSDVQGDEPELASYINERLTAK